MLGVVGQFLRLGRSLGQNPNLRRLLLHSQAGFLNLQGDQALGLLGGGSSPIIKMARPFDGAGRDSPPDTSDTQVRNRPGR